MLSELNENLISIKKDQSEIKDTLTEMKNNLQGIKSGMDKTKNQSNDKEHKETKNNQSEQGKKRIIKNEDSVSSLWDNFKQSNIRIMGVPEGEEKEQEIANYLKK